MTKVEVLRDRGLTKEDLTPIISDLQAVGFQVETDKYIEKGLDAVIQAGLLFIVYLAADETAREFLRLAWRKILNHVGVISQLRGPTRFGVKFRDTSLGPLRRRSFSIQARTNETDALPWIDKTVTRLVELGVKSVLDDLPPGARNAHADRDMSRGEEIIVAYSGSEPFDLDLSDGNWKPHKARKGKSKRKGGGKGTSS